MKIGCGTVSFRTLSIEEAMERIARAGYPYVETQATAPFCPHVDVDRDDPDAYKRLEAKFGFLGTTALWAPHGAIIPDAQSVEHIRRAIAWAGAAGIPVVNAGDGHKPKDMSDDDAMAVLADRLAAILEQAAASRVHLAIEPHGTFSLTPDGLLKIMLLSDSEWLGINYDTANVRRASYVETRDGAYTWKLFGEPQDEVATLRTVVGHVCHCHVKDVAGPACVALGAGEVNVAGCIGVLREHGYDGAVSLETEGDFDAETGQRLIEASREFLARVVTP